MNKVVQRLLIFFIGIPVVLGIVFLKQFHHLVLNTAILLFTVAGTYEFYDMCVNLTKRIKLTGDDGTEKQLTLYPKWSFILFGAVLPLITFVFIILDIEPLAILWVLIIEIFIILAVEAFFRKSFEGSLLRVALFITGLFYSGYMVTFLQKISTIKYDEGYSVHYISLFLILVFMCDSLAWFFGVLFGKSNRGIFKVSPNKSIVGFIGGLFGSVACGVVMKYIFPQAFDMELWRYLIVCFVTALATIAGDLIESVFKRSCGVKDSGNLIPGRGGVLDSIDSILISAPIFYISAFFLFNI